MRAQKTIKRGCYPSSLNELGSNPVVRSISCNADMVHSFLDNRKTETRRLDGLEAINKHPGKWKSVREFPRSPYARFNAYSKADFTGENIDIQCPYGIPGDILYVCEAWANAGDQVLFKANERYGEYLGQKWNPIKDMPKSHSRIWLKITAIDLERLSDITFSAAEAEGVKKSTDTYLNYETGIYSEYFPESSFRTLMRSIYGPKITDWNPWVWVITVEKITNPDFII